MEKKRTAGGIPFSQGEIDALHELAERSGIKTRLEEAKKI
jgi:hypothetical protein